MQKTVHHLKQNLGHALRSEQCYLPRFSENEEQGESGKKVSRQVTDRGRHRWLDGPEQLMATPDGFRALSEAITGLLFVAWPVIAGQLDSFSRMCFVLLVYKLSGVQPGS